MDQYVLLSKLHAHIYDHDAHLYYVHDTRAYYGLSKYMHYGHSACTEYCHNKSTISYKACWANSKTGGLRGREPQLVCQGYKGSVAEAQPLKFL